MIFTPSQEIHDRLRMELSCAFVDRSSNESHRWLVVKLPNNLIREIMAGAPLTLRAWVVAIDENLVLTFGLTVTDDPVSPMTVFGSCRSDAEEDDLCVMLAGGAFPVQFFNETFLPLLYADCRIDAGAAAEVLALAPSVGYPEAEGLKIREQANDVVQEVLSGKADTRVRASFESPLTFAATRTTDIIVPGVGPVTLTDTNEGAEFERLTLQGFEFLFPFGAFINPWVGEGKKGRELCDVLAVSRNREAENEGIFVVQNKAASAFPDGLSRTTERRASAITKDILDGIRQLGGAIRAIRAGRTIYRCKGGTSVEIDPAPDVPVETLNLKERANQVGHALVVVSEMHWQVDWDEVMAKLAVLSRKTGYCCQVLDLPELGRLITHSHRRPAVLEDLLIRRFSAMAEKMRPDIRFNFVLKPAGK